MLYQLTSFCIASFGKYPNSVAHLTALEYVLELSLLSIMTPRSLNEFTAIILLPSTFISFGILDQLISSLYAIICVANTFSKTFASGGKSDIPRHWLKGLVISGTSVFEAAFSIFENIPDIPGPLDVDKFIIKLRTVSSESSLNSNSSLISFSEAIIDETGTFDMICI
ncbi:hypothetical protein BpHYR1_004308 [Brachionus plicatilis]|uniref:Uncharacterized protein n=1 Tax=Brachionus plicatilis TaxID=10195 RepID=A0A3M7QSC0_BRAPC|nr:hypothetical protein BpHYR1_004308 [Brachionus plicatilis]